MRVWAWPEVTGKSSLIPHARDDLQAWQSGRVVGVADCGFSSADNRAYLSRDGEHYIIGE